MFGICNLSIVPLRKEPFHYSEMTNQVLFGEYFEILEKNKEWSKIRLFFDSFEGFISNKQYKEISEATFNKLSSEKNIYAGNLVDFITDENNGLTTIPLGSNLPFYNNNKLFINTESFHYEGKINSGRLQKNSIIEIAYLFLNTPYLLGGKTPFGIDCSGFTQMVYKLCGYNLFRETTKQATQGEVLNFLEESEAGDLAFFDDDEGNITHVGIVMNNNNIIHVDGKVRIDKLDHSGIYNIDERKHTHKLRVIKQYIF